MMAYSESSHQKQKKKKTKKSMLLGFIAGGTLDLALRDESFGVLKPLFWTKKLFLFRFNDKNRFFGGRR